MTSSLSVCRALSRGSISVAVSAWQCQCGSVSVAVSAWQCQRGSVSVAVSAWQCQRGSGRQCKAVPVRRDSNDEEYFDVCLIM